MTIKDISEQIEKVSLNYSKKFDVTRDSNWFILKLQEELGELIQAYLMLIGQARRKGKSDQELKSDFEKEITDVFCHILLLAKHHNVDLVKGVEEKWLSWDK